MQIDLDQLMLQQPPFRFVDELLHFGDDKTVTAFTVREGLLTEDGHLCAEGLVEHMAQSAAVRAGYIARYIRHVPVAFGIIGEVRDLLIHRLPAVGEKLETDVYLLHEVFGITQTDVQVRSRGELLAAARIKTADR